MSYAVWSDMYSIRVPYIDAQHQKLLAIANDFHEAVRQGKGKDAVFQILNRLTRYAETHFQDEEEIMELAGCPEQEMHSHKEIHSRLVEEIFELQGEYEAGKPRLLHDVELFLNGWLVNHILMTDKKLEPYCGSLSNYHIHKGKKPE